jgi:hypothetical protein
MDASLQADNDRTAINIDHSTTVRQAIYHLVINFFVTWSWNAQKPRTAPGLSRGDLAFYIWLYSDDDIAPGFNDLPRHWALMIAIRAPGP